MRVGDLRRISLAALILPLFSFGNGWAQQSPPVMEGEKIRFSYCGEVDPEGHVVAHCASAEGRVQRVAGDTLVVDRKQGRGSLATRFRWVTKLEVSHGYKSNVLPGLVVGATATALLLAASTDQHYSDCNDYMTVCALTGLAFVGTGTVVGLLLSGEKWDEVPPDLLRVSVVAQRDGRLGIGLSLAF
jgi:hypothetical protein